jgi:hypothetical protein
MLQKWGLDPTTAPPPVLASEEPIVRFFSYHDAHPVAIMLVLMERFGVEWFAWEPDTLKQEILRSFKATSVSEHNWQKIQAIRTLTATIGFWVEWHIFEKIIQALNNNVPRFDISQRCTIPQLMAGVDIANQIRDYQYGDEIQRYVAACALDEGVSYVPPPIDFAQLVLARPMYRCHDCGMVNTDDLDGRCDFCTGRFTDHHPLNFKPNPLLPVGLGKNVEKFLSHDPAPVKKRLDEIRSNPEAAKLSGDSPEDVQASKLVVAYDYMNHRSQQLVDQLEELKSWVSQ